jgi:hypothetical protein
MKTRKLVIEHNILTTSEEKLPAIILDGLLWGGDFENLASEDIDDPITYDHNDGFNKFTNQKVTYSQTFIRTEKTDEQLLEEYK